MEIRTQEELETAVRLIVENTWFWFWLGANKQGEEGQWLWDSNQEVVNLDEFWEVGKPTNYIGFDCLTMDYHRAGYYGLDDWYCDEMEGSVCEYN